MKAILLNDQEVQTDALKPTLVALKAADPEMSVVVRGGGDIDYQRVITVLDAFAAGGDYEDRPRDRDGP